MARKVTARDVRAGARLVVEPGDPLADPPTEGAVHLLPTAVEVGGDALDRPPLAVQPDNRQACRRRIGDLPVGREPAGGAGGRRLLQDALDRVRAGALVEADRADVRNLAGVEGGVLGLEVADGCPDLRGQPLVLLDFQRREEACHPLGVEARRPTVDGALGGTGLVGALGRRATEEHHRAQQLVGPLLREGRE